jgi:uncharacterized membrane protein
MDTSVRASSASTAVNCFKRYSLLAAMLTGFTTPALAMDWQIKNLGTLPGATYSTGNAINDLGQVAGSTDAGAVYDPERGLVYGAWAFLSGPNGGPLQMVDNGPERDRFFAFQVGEVNNLGQVVGSMRQGSSVRYAYTSGPNGSTLTNAIPIHEGIDVNNSGSALYQSWQGAVEVVKPDGTITVVAFASDEGVARGINDAGQVAMTYPYRDVWQGIMPTGVVWSESTGYREIRVNGENTDLFDINNAGQVLGHKFGSLSEIFVMNSDGSFTILDLPGTLLLDKRDFSGISVLPRFNDSGQIVGSLLAEDGTSFSFLTSISGEDFINLSMQEDIIAAGWSNIMVSDINNLGQISGTGIINGQTRAFLLTPVPEPETYAMMLAGLSLLGFMRRRKAVQA